MSVAVLDDPIGLVPQLERHLSAHGPVDASVALVVWKRASSEEVASLTALRERHEGPIVVILCEVPATRGARALAAQVEGAVLLDELDRTLEPTLVAVAAGQTVFPAVLRRVAQRPPLSPRERQLLGLVVLGFQNSEIAAKLYMSESNVKSHLTSAFQKIGVRSRNAAVDLILDAESGLGPGILRLSPDGAD